MIKLALAKGRITQDALPLLEALGFDPGVVTASRKLILTNEKEDVALVFLKPSDIPLYVSQGAVDLGIVGKDTVLENDLELYELLSMDMAKCAMCLAGPKEKKPMVNGIRIATKYPRITNRFLEELGVTGEIIPLSGSVELAPLIDLSDVIVDLVQTGQTLKENGLEVYEVILDISAMLIANKVSYKTKADGILKFLKVCEGRGTYDPMLSIL